MGSGLLTRLIGGILYLHENSLLEMALLSPSRALINCFGMPFPSPVVWSAGL